ncbi:MULTISPECIES: hypothetical protein [unclassified Dinoroseobacter]|uniref:hypothetical protein n=1 Tax=unclassified Dinoroseobacter TaxID=2620028 RepID=UPI003C7D504C
MSQIIETLADALARDALEAAARLDNDQLITEVGKQLGASSSTMEEAYQTYIRVRQAEARARRFLESQLPGD